MDDVHHLMLAAIRLEKHAFDLLEAANGIYDRAVVLAIHDAECLSRHVKEARPVPANIEEDM